MNIEDVKKICPKCLGQKRLSDTKGTKADGSYGFIDICFACNGTGQICNLEPKGGLLTDEEIHEYAKDPDVRGYPIKSGWLTDEIMEHIKDIVKAQQSLTAKEKDRKRKEENSVDVTEAYFKGRQDGLMIKEAECRERIEKLAEEHSMWIEGRDGKEEKAIDYNDFLQSLKEGGK